MGSIALRADIHDPRQTQDAFGWAGQSEPPGDDEMATLLRRLIDCDVVTLIVIGPAGSVGHQRKWVGDQSDAGTKLTTARWMDHPLRQHLAVRGLSRVPFRVAGSGEGQRPVDRLVLPIRSTGQQVVCWTLTKLVGRFGPRDLHIAELVMPGLRAAVAPVIQALTERELDVLQLIALGLTSTSIARRCGVSVRTVHKHLEHIYDKLGCRDRVSAALMLCQADPIPT